MSSATVVINWSGNYYTYSPAVALSKISPHPMRGYKVYNIKWDNEPGPDMDSVVRMLKENDEFLLSACNLIIRKVL